MKKTPKHTQLIGAFIRNARHERGLSCRALAARTKGEVSHSTIVRMEQGRTVIFKHLVAVLTVLGFSLVVARGVMSPTTFVTHP